MERNEIIKDLECCKFGKDEAKCKECNWHPWIKPRCWRLLASNALSLINELTAENESLSACKKELINDNAELKNQLKEEITEDDIDLSDELLKLHIEGIKEAKADTVRKMQEEIKRRCIEGGIYPALVARTIDKVAKEMLNDES